MWKLITPYFFIQGELTYGKIGEWRFDKRSYLMGPPPRNLPLPPQGVPESVVSHTSNFWVFCFEIVNHSHLDEELMLEICYFPFSVNCYALS